MVEFLIIFYFIFGVLTALYVVDEPVHGYWEWIVFVGVVLIWPVVLGIVFYERRKANFR